MALHDARRGSTRRAQQGWHRSAPQCSSHLASTAVSRPEKRGGARGPGRVARSPSPLLLHAYTLAGRRVVRVAGDHEQLERSLQRSRPPHPCRRRDPARLRAWRCRPGPPRTRWSSKVLRQAGTCSARKYTFYRSREEVFADMQFDVYTCRPRATRTVPATASEHGVRVLRCRTAGCPRTRLQLRAAAVARGPTRACERQAAPPWNLTAVQRTLRRNRLCPFSRRLPAPEPQPLPLRFTAATFAWTGFLTGGSVV